MLMPDAIEQNDGKQGTPDDLIALAGHLLATDSLLLAQVDADLRYRHVSRGLARELGCDVDELVGENSLRHGFSPRHQAVMQSVLVTGQEDLIRNWTVKSAGHSTPTQAYWQWKIVPMPGRKGLLLWARDVTERRLLESDVIAAAAQERREVGSEIHEHIGQLMAALSMKTKGLEILLSEENSNGQYVARELRELTTEVISTLRRIARRLYPVHAERGGLISGLQHLAKDTMELYDVSCRVTASDREPELESVQAVHIHAIVKQAIRHAVHQADAKELTVDFVEESDYFEVRMVHDGKAYKRLGTIQGYRLMTFHAHTIGGTISVDGAKGGPVTFRGRFPRRLENHT
jgi:signal transduction histidine kinase